MITTLQTALFAQDVTIVNRPYTDGESVNYHNSRSPLRRQSFIKLPVGSIRPSGWIGRMLELQRDGLTGHLGEISAWLDKNGNAWLQDGGDHGWEEVPYWLKGYSTLAYLLGDKQMIAETQTWIEGVFHSQRPDGFFGPENRHDGKPELWAQMIMLTTLQTYYDYSGDKRVIDLMTRYFRWELALPDDQFLEDYWENSRGGDNLLSVLWLYDHTGDAFLLELAEKIHRNTANWHQDTNLPNWHNVNIAQCFREPATYYMLTGDSTMLKATYNDQQLVRRIFGQVPGGMFGSDENCRMGYVDPRQAVETCGMVEQMASDEILLRLTGDPAWADNCEDVAFNSYPAAVMPDFRALRYLTAPNMPISDARNHAPGIQNEGPFLAMNPFSSRCCQHNHAQGWPYYAEHLMLATQDNGVAVALYGDCTAKMLVGNKRLVTIKEETHYPFEEEVRFTLGLKKNTRFPLYLRVPEWTDEIVLDINGTEQRVSGCRGQYLRVEHDWTDGTRIGLRLPMKSEIRQWSLNKNSVSINYGPLTFSLKIKERAIRLDSRQKAISDSRWQEGVDASLWPTTELYPDSPWNYALCLTPQLQLPDIQIIHRPWPADNYPFTAETSPIEAKVHARRIDSWTIDEYGLCGILPDEDAVRNDETETVTLIPMGAARLRISAFPTAKF